MKKIIIDAENAIMGRLASYVAKRALSGNEVIVVNCEKTLISGRKENIIEDYKAKRSLNRMKPTKGPYFSRQPDRILKRAIRGMLPDFRRGRGKEAWKKIKCYIGIPEEFKKEKIEKIKVKISKKNMNLQELKERI